MARPTQSARVQKWRGVWYLFYRDHRTGRKIRHSCEQLGAVTPEARRELVKFYRRLEDQFRIETIRRGWQVSGDAVLIQDIDQYLVDCRDRVATRTANPDARDGLSPRTMLRIQDTVGHFRAWLVATNRGKLRSADLAPDTLEAYFRHVVRQDTRRGNRATKRSASTVNVYKRNVKSCLRWIQRLRPRRFLDLEELVGTLKSLRTNRTLPFASSPESLGAFMQRAEKREHPDRVVSVPRTSASGGRAEYLQPATARASTPVSRLFLLLALTGCRLGEALNLRWSDVDLDRGRIVFRAGKTGMTRWLPLVGAAEGTVAPEFLKLLSVWRSSAPAAVFVLPHGSLPRPVFPKLGWYAVANQGTTERIIPQRLRQNFTSYAASLGVPAAVTAMWQGHSAVVAEKFYRAQLLDRNPLASTFEEAMGLLPSVLVAQQDRRTEHEVKPAKTTRGLPEETFV